MEQLDLIKITPDGKRAQQTHQDEKHTTKQPAQKVRAQDDDFFEMLSRSQSKRMDDQRCSIKITKNPIATGVAAIATRKPLTQQNSISGVSSDVVVSSASGLPGLKSSSTGAPSSSSHHGHLARSATTTQQPDDAFLDMLMRCQGSRLEEQRSELPRSNITMDVEAAPVPVAVRGRNSRGGAGGAGGTTVPDEDFFSLIMKVQSGRMEDQRAAIPFGGFTNNNNNNNINNSNSRPGASAGAGASAAGSQANTNANANLK